jgi:hypothetical protein
MAKKDKNNRFVYGHFTNGNDYLALVKPPVARVTRNGGSHAKVEMLQGVYKGQSMIVCERDMGIGLSHKIWSWFKMVGLLTIMFAAFAFAFVYLGL